MEFVVVDLMRCVDINAHLRKYEFGKRNIMEAFYVTYFVLWNLDALPAGDSGALAFEDIDDRNGAVLQ